MDPKEYIDNYIPDKNDRALDAVLVLFAVTAIVLFVWWVVDQNMEISKQTEQRQIARGETPVNQEKECFVNKRCDFGPLIEQKCTVTKECKPKRI